LSPKTVGIDILSDGQTGVGLNLTAYNAHIAKVNGTWSLVFNFHASVVGTVLHWNVEKVTADNCKIKIIGIEIASVCGYIESHVKDKVQTLTNQVMTVTAPNLLKKLQDKINTVLANVVVIPLKMIVEYVMVIILLVQAAQMKVHLLLMKIQASHVMIVVNMLIMMD
jgi:hypothetical protein